MGANLKSWGALEKGGGELEIYSQFIMSSVV